jgi:tight adherence protein C
MIYITFFCTVFLVLYGLILVPSKKKQHVNERITTYLDGVEAPSNQAEMVRGKEPAIFKQLFKTLWVSGARGVKKRMPKVKVEKMEMRLLKAGSPMQMSPFDFRLLQTTSLVVLPSFYGVLGFIMGLDTDRILLFVVIGLGFGLIIPNSMLNSRIKKRAKTALKELPDFVDLLTVSLEAGLGFDSALSKVIQKQKGVLADEFHRCLDEVRLGKTRREGLAGIKKRLDVDEISTLINSIIRAEKLGVGMVQVLRIQSAEVREKRKQRAEEQAMKAPIKILFPLVLFIFPSLFIIILGPAVIQIINTFK